MEIETKIFELKKIRKVLKEHDLEPHHISDIVDYFFDLSDFRIDDLVIRHASRHKSGAISVDDLSLEIADPDVLKRLEKFLASHDHLSIKIRIRVTDSIPFVTFKGPKTLQKGVKSRDEIEVRVGNLSDAMQLFLTAGARFVKSISRIREIYDLPKYPNSELVIDTYHFAHDTLEYAEIESPTTVELKKLMKDFFLLEKKHFSGTGITSLHQKQEEKVISKRLKMLREAMESEEN